MALAAFYSGCASLSDKWRETPLPAERILAARAAAAAFSRSASLGMRTPVAMPENFSLRRLAVCTARQWCGVKADLVKSLRAAASRLQRKLHLWQDAAPVGADAVGESASTGELFALGFSPSAVSAAVSASHRAVTGRASTASASRSFGSRLSATDRSLPSLRKLSSAGKAAATVSSTQFEAAEDAVEYRDRLASRSQDRRAARDRLRHEVTVPLPERGGDFRAACRSAARQLVEETGLRLELVDPTWSTDPTARLHQWAVRWEQKGAQRRQRLSQKQEGELKRVVMAHLKQDWRRRLGETNETYSRLLRPSQSARAERTSRCVQNS